MKCYHTILLFYYFGDSAPPGGVGLLTCRLGAASLPKTREADARVELEDGAETNTWGNQMQDSTSR